MDLSKVGERLPIGPIDSVHLFDGEGEDVGMA